MKKLFFSKWWSVLSLTVIALCSCIMGISALKNITVLAATQQSFSVSNVQTSSYAKTWGTSPLGVMFKDTNLPTVTGDTFLVRGSKIPEASASGGDYTPAEPFTALAIDDEKISYTRADGQTGRLWRLGFTPFGYIHFLFDNFTGAEKGVILAGDTFTVADGFSFIYQDVVYTVTEGETYVYNGTAWAKEERTFSVSGVQTSSYATAWGTSPLGVMFKDTNLPTVTGDTFLVRGSKIPEASASGGDYTPAEPFTALAIDDEKISYTRADGQTGRLWRLGFTPDGYIHFLFDNFTDAEKGVILEGDTFTVADGFSFTYQDVVYTVTEGETYVYDGSDWKLQLKDVLVAMNVNLQGAITTRFIYTLPNDVIEDSTSKLTVIVRNNTYVYTVSEAVNSDGRFAFDVPVAAAEMTESIKLQWTTSTAKGKLRSCMLKDYADVVIAKGSEEQKAMVKALLNYGAYAQKYFDVNTDKLANGDLSADDTSLEHITAINETVSKQDSNAIQFLGYDVVLNSTTELMVYFTCGNIADYTFSISDGVNTVSTEAVLDQDTGNYYLVFQNITAVDLGTEYTFTVSSKNNGEDKATFTASIYSYLASMLEQTEKGEDYYNLAKAIYAYGEASKTFFGV